MFGDPAGSSVIDHVGEEPESSRGTIAASLRGLARIIQEGLLQKGADAKRDGHSEGLTARLSVTAVYPLLQQKLHESCGLGGEFGEPKGIEVLVEPFTVHQFSMAAGFHKAPFVEDENAVSSLDGR